MHAVVKFISKFSDPDKQEFWNQLILKLTYGKNYTVYRIGIVWRRIGNMASFSAMPKL